MQRVISTKSRMRIRTSRIGPLTFTASAPIVDGTVSDSELTFTVRIDEVATGNPLLDPELHALIHRLTSGTLTFSGRRQGHSFRGQASAGDITIPLDLSADAGDAAMEVVGSSTFHDLHVPLPGMGHIEHLEVDIDGHLFLE